MPEKFPNIDRKEEDAHRVDELVDAHFERPRKDKSRSKSEVAHEIIKEKRSDQLDLSNFSPEEREWYENMRDTGIRVLKNGFIEVSRWDIAGSGESRKKSRKIKRWQRVDGINSAIRMQDHILKQYHVGVEGNEGELSQLDSMQEVIENANDMLNQWNSASNNEKRNIQISLAELVLQLEKCRNEFKASIRERAGSVVGLKDSRDRENPFALAARTVGAINDLYKRMNELQIIIPTIALRKEILVLEKRRMSGNINKAAGHIQSLLRHPVFLDKKFKTPEQSIKDYEIPIMNRKIGQALHFIDSLRVLPYSQQAEQAKYFIQTKAKKYFSSKSKVVTNRGEIKDAFEEAHKILLSDVEHLG